MIGTVSKFVSKHRLWGIKYDDGDAEEMEYNDLKRGINLFDKHNKKKKVEDTKKKAASSSVKATTTKSNNKPKEQTIIVAAEKTAAVAVGKKKRATRSAVTAGDDELEELEKQQPSSAAKSKRAKRGESNTKADSTTPSSTEQEDETAETKGGKNKKGGNQTKETTPSADQEGDKDAPQRKTRGDNATKSSQPAQEGDVIDAKKKISSSPKSNKQDAVKKNAPSNGSLKKNGTRTKQPDAAISSSEQIEVVSSSDAVDTSPTTQNFRVVRMTYLKNSKNQPGSCNEEHIVGEYSTREEANEAAKTAMHNTAQFEDWGETQFADKPPPYSSADGPFEVTADEDETVDIFVMDIAKTNANTKRVREAVLATTASATKAAEPSSASNKKAKKLSTAGSEPPQQKLKPERKFGKVAAHDIIVDEHLFHHNPCRIPGGKSNHPKKYPNFHKKTGSFGFLIQRLSDRNYAMRALCLDGYGAQYNTYKKEHVSYISVVWYPPNNLKDHRDDATIVDGCHLDLIDPTDGKTYLTGSNTQKAVENAGVPVECLFLNGAQSNLGSAMTAGDVASTIAMCKESLLCVSLTECKLNGAILNELASCTKLRGLIIENCQIWGKGDDKPTDAMLAAVLGACVDLQWCFVKSSIFSANCWDMLDNTDTCPNLEVLWIDAPTHTKDRVDVARGDVNAIYRALNSRAKKLKICMINPDEKNNSRFIIGGASKTNRLNGRSREESSGVRSSGNYLSSI